MTGFESSIRVHPSGPSPSAVTRLPRPVATAFRSAPAQKNPPVPVRIATLSDVVGIEAAKCAREFLRRRMIDRVARLGAIDGDDREVFFDIEIDEAHL